MLVGIGKSAFLLFALLFLFHKRARGPSFAIVTRIFGGPYIVFRADGSDPTSDPNAVAHAMDQTDTWFLFDTQPEYEIFNPYRSCYGHTIFTSEPLVTSQYWASKLGASERTLPIWNLAEIFAARQSCFPTVTIELLLERIALFGCVPRHVLRNAMSDEHINVATERLNRALNQVGDNGAVVIRHIICHSFADPKWIAISHLLFHLHPIGDGIKTRVAFASKHIRDVLMKKDVQNGLSACKNWLKSTS